MTNKPEDLFEIVPLCDDLKPYVYESEVGWPVLHHPLVIVLPFSEIQAKHANLMYEHKKKAACEALAKRKWGTYVVLHERPYRLPALLEVLEKGLKDEPPAEIWNLIGDMWTDSENIHQHLDDWMELWNLEIPERHLAMSEEERQALQALPENLKVWRGVTHTKGQRGLSWTLDRDRAVWFAHRLRGSQQKSYLVSGTVRKTDVIAHFKGRNEDEIVALPEDIRNFRARILRN